MIDTTLMHSTIVDQVLDYHPRIVPLLILLTALFFVCFAVIGFAIGAAGSPALGLTRPPFIDAYTRNGFRTASQEIEQNQSISCQRG